MAFNMKLHFSAFILTVLDFARAFRTLEKVTASGVAVAYGSALEYLIIRKSNASERNADSGSWLFAHELITVLYDRRFGLTIRTAAFFISVYHRSVEKITKKEDQLPHHRQSVLDIAD
jgi:hypothetical protein